VERRCKHKCGERISQVADPSFTLRSTQDAVGKPISTEWHGRNRNSPVLGARRAEGESGSRFRYNSSIKQFESGSRFRYDSSIKQFESGSRFRCDSSIKQFESGSRFRYNSSIKQFESGSRFRYDSSIKSSHFWLQPAKS